MLRLTFLFACFAQSVLAGSPFGITMGQSLDSLDIVETGTKPLLNSVPNPHPKFNKYSVWASESSGVCALIAFTEPYENDRYGGNVRSDFQSFVTALSGKYGSTTYIDSFAIGGMWDEPGEWVMSIVQNERVFSATWDTFDDLGEGRNFEYLELRVLAMSSSKTELRLTYRFENFTECVEEIEAEENSSF